MFLFQTVIGRVIEVRRYVNGPSRWARWGNWRERQEFWLTGKEGAERKWIVHTATFPARRGHDVIALVHKDKVIGLFNESTGDSVNYLRTDPPSLLRLRDLWLSVFVLTVLPVWLGLPGLVLAVLATVALHCAAMAGRSLVRRHHAGRVDEAFGELHRIRGPQQVCFEE